MAQGRLTATAFYGYYRPSTCELRVYLREQRLPESDPTPYERVLRRLGARHEDEHRRELGGGLDLGQGPQWIREVRTRRAFGRGAPLIYQGRLRARARLAAEDWDIVGEPDFMIQRDGGYVIRDSKLTRRIDGHPEIALQLQTYGWLYEQVVGSAPTGLEVHSGSGAVVGIEYDGGASALARFEEIAGLRRRTDAPTSPVGWSKCAGCGFRGHCWPRALSNRDVALVVGVDQGLAKMLYAEGVTTVDELVARYDASQLSAVERPWGTRRAMVGSRAAEAIIQMATALASGHEIVLQPPALPTSDNHVVFDLEGLPPQLDEVEKVYLWGVQVFGASPSDFQAATAGFGVEGDRQGWLSFLALAQQIFERYGDIPFVHWATYERTKLDLYVGRFGDRDGIAARVRANLVDLLPITQASVAMPVPSYSLKVVEKYVGYARQLPETGGDWAMARYIEATETPGAQARSEAMAEILAYNREDLEATWAVFEWLRDLTDSHREDPNGA